MSSKAIKLQPNNLITLNQYAALIINNDLKEAVKILERYHKTFDHEDFALNLSTAYKEIGEFENQIKLLTNNLNVIIKIFSTCLDTSH